MFYYKSLCLVLYENLKIGLMKNVQRICELFYNLAVIFLSIGGTSIAFAHCHSERGVRVRREREKFVVETAVNRKVRVRDHDFCHHTLYSVLIIKVTERRIYYTLRKKTFNSKILFIRFDRFFNKQIVLRSL